MISEKGISGKAPKIPSLDFNFLRKQAIECAQGLSGEIWTDYNLHDPGVTLLEILCYAITDCGYRTQQLKNTFRSQAAIADSYTADHLFKKEELLSVVPVTLIDIETYIESHNDSVQLAWVTTFSILKKDETIKGGYAVSLFLKENGRYSDLNSDTLQITLDEHKIIVEIILFDAENNRLAWDQIDKIRGCKVRGDDAAFFQFEKFNAQVNLLLEVKWLQQKNYETVPVKARISISGIEKTLPRNTGINQYEQPILSALGSKDFMGIVTEGLEKEEYKAKLLRQVHQTLLPVRNLCEVFTKFTVVNRQEITVQLQLELTPNAPKDAQIVQLAYDRLDDFTIAIVKSSRSAERQGQRNVLYGSKLVAELMQLEGIKTAHIVHLNLYIDGIPTVSHQEEGTFDCLQLQGFDRYIPKINRNRSSVTLVRNGLKNTLSPSGVAATFTERSLGSFLGKNAESASIFPKKRIFDKDFMDELNAYYSIQHDFPQNYRLSPGKLPERAGEDIKAQQKRFKSYLLFYERILVDYIERLSNFNKQLSLKPAEKAISHNLGKALTEKLEDVKNLDLVDAAYFDREKNATYPQNLLEQRDQTLDHLLARFGTSYKDIQAMGTEITLEQIEAKTRLLKDIPSVTKNRGLGQPIMGNAQGVWGTDVLSGFQKKVYRLFGAGGNTLLFEKLSDRIGSEAKGFYVLEHRLLLPREERSVHDKQFNKTASLIRDFLSDLLAPHPFNYSFELTVLAPNWNPQWAQKKKAYEDLIEAEAPAYIKTHIHWMAKKDLVGFELLYEDWLKTLFKVYE